MLRIPEYASCDSPFACAAAPIISRKWVPVTVCHLLNGPRRFSEIMRNIPFVSAKVMTENLRFMQGEGMIIREVRGDQPVEVWYHLTDRGKDLATVIRAMNMWGQKWLQIPVGSESATYADDNTRPKKTVIPVASQW